jgi:nitrite reductase/ring-hydroxylating ferredoxin subunit
MIEVEVGPLDDLAEGVPRIVTVGGREIAVVRWRGRLFAIRNSCPHQTVSFAAGTVVERVVGAEQLGDVSVDEADPVIRCPRHGWRFGLASGRCTADPRLRMRTYDVTVRDGRVFLATGRPKSRAPA